MARMVLLVLGATILVLNSTVYAGVPSYIRTCGRRNPNFDQCVIDSVDNLLPRLKHGIPELNVPGIEPMEVEEIPLSELKDFRAVAYNVKLSGVSNFKIKFLHVDLEKQQIDLEIIFPKIIMNSDYDVNAKILVPIHEKGPIQTITENVYTKATLKFEKVTRKGKTRIYFPTITAKVVIPDYEAVFMPGSESNPVAQAINSVLVNSRKEIIESMTPNIEKAISAKVLSVSNLVCKNFTYDELFPDRE
ncbi:hypothetical protein QAD02_004927 [Eretmocerus hayati]|uniref:Uncharacterized protein n=1 Tax=Eretmocerus hayati TaxID=131215 RepID=A0ACC2NVS7_9HYME|nr:hypothetical protein QAD02_004927 [Eretmocerus hayati]